MTEEIIKLYRNNETTYQEIANTVGCSKSKVYNIVKKAIEGGKLEPRAKWYGKTYKPPVSPEIAQKVIDMYYVQNRTRAEVAEELKLHRKTIDNIMQKARKQGQAERKKPGRKPLFKMVQPTSNFIATVTFDQVPKQKFFTSE